MNCRSFEQGFFMKFAKALRRLLDEFPNFLEVNILRQPLASRPDGSQPAFVNIAVHMIKIKYSLMLSYATG